LGEIAIFKHPDVFFYFFQHQSGAFSDGDILPFEVSDACFVDADADSGFVHLSCVDYSQDTLPVFYIAGVQPYFGGPGLYRFDSTPGAEVNIGYQWDVYLPDDFRKGSGICTRGYGDSDQPAAGPGKLIYLFDTTGDIDCRNLRHRLNDNGGTGADSNLPDIDGFRFSSFDHIKIVTCFRLTGKLKYARRLIGH